MSDENRKPTIPEVLDRFQRYHRDNPVWGPLNTVLEAGDTKDDHVRYVIQLAREQGDVEGEQLGLILLRMSGTQRSKLGKLPWPK